MNEYEYIKNVVMFVFGIIFFFFFFFFLVMFAILSGNIKGHLLERLAHGVVTAFHYLGCLITCPTPYNKN